MQGQEALTSIIEVGIGIAGFSSIVVTLSRNHLTEEIKTAFRQIWLQSGIIITFSAIPLILSTTDVKPESIYVIASYMYGAAMVLGLIFGPARKRFRSHPILLIVTLFPLLHFYNAVYLGQAWPYLCILLAGIVMAFLSFYQLIQYLWNRDNAT
jgi:hypothetical protein